MLDCYAISTIVHSNRLVVKQQPLMGGIIWRCQDLNKELIYGPRRESLSRLMGDANDPTTRSSLFENNERLCSTTEHSTTTTTTDSLMLYFGLSNLFVCVIVELVAL